MSNMYEDEYETPAMRVLREKADADSALIREMRDELSKMREKQARAELEAVLSAQGLDPKVANLVPQDVDPSGWLKANGSLFAQKQVAATEENIVESEKPQPDLLAQAEADALAAIADSSANSEPVSGLADLEAQVRNADSPEAVAALLAKHLGNTKVQF